MTLPSSGINGYNASLIGRFGVGDVGRYGFALGDTTTIAFPQTGTPTDQGMGPVMQPNTVDDSGAFSFLTSGTDANGFDAQTCANAGRQWVNNACALNTGAPVGQTSTSTALLFLAAAVGVIFLVK